MKYIENLKTANHYRQDYIDSLNEVIKGKREEVDKNRLEYFFKMKDNQEKYREELKKMFGWPLTEKDNEIPIVKKEFMFSEDDIEAFRMQFELPIGIKFYGMYFTHKGKENLPLVIAQHGRLGTPERISGVLDDGTVNYNDMAMRVFNKGVNVFMPQLLLWSEAYEVDYDREKIDKNLKQIGSSITAVEVYSIIKCIDYLCTEKCINKDRIGMVGLSYGGFFTLVTTAIDKRIKSAIASSQYNNRYEYDFEDWVWFNSANKFLDNEIASLVYPRYISIVVGNQDEIFDYKFAEYEYQKLKEMVADSDWIDFEVFEGNHEFIKDDRVIDKFMEKF